MIMMMMMMMMMIKKANYRCILLLVFAANNVDVACFIAVALLKTALINTRQLVGARNALLLKAARFIILHSRN